MDHLTFAIIQLANQSDSQIAKRRDSTTSDATGQARRVSADELMTCDLRLRLTVAKNSVMKCDVTLQKDASVVILHSSCSFRHIVWQPLAVARFLLQPQHLEHLACPCPVITNYLNLSPMAKYTLVPTVISRHHYMTLLTMLSCMNFEMVLLFLVT